MSWLEGAIVPVAATVHNNAETSATHDGNILQNSMLAMG
jgi:hypothetical protein